MKTDKKNFRPTSLDYFLMMLLIINFNSCLLDMGESSGRGSVDNYTDKGDPLCYFTPGITLKYGDEDIYEHIAYAKEGQSLGTLNNCIDLALSVPEVAGGVYTSELSYNKVCNKTEPIVYVNNLCSSLSHKKVTHRTTISDLAGNTTEMKVYCCWSVPQD